MLNIAASIFIATSAGGFYFQDKKGLAVACLIFSFLFAIGYFDVNKSNKSNKKSVM